MSMQTEAEIQESHRQAERLNARLYGSSKKPNGAAAGIPSPLSETIDPGIVAGAAAKQSQAEGVKRGILPSEQYAAGTVTGPNGNTGVQSGGSDGRGDSASAHWDVMTNMLALHRDAPVICANPTCGRRVKRRSRRQKYCSSRCGQMARHYAVKPALGGDTQDDPNPPKKVNVSNVVHAAKSKSDLIRNAVQTEFIAGHQWERVVSPDGVVAFVAQLRRPTYSSGRA